MCGLALLYYSDVLNESPSGRSLHIKQIKVKIFSCWNIASPFPKLFCAHLHVPDCIEKIWIDLTLSLFCCCQGIFNHLSSIISLCIFSCKPHSKSRLPCAPCVWVGQFPPRPPLRLSSLCVWHIHRSQSLPSVVCRSWSFLFRLVGLPLKWLPLKLLWLSGYTCLSASTSAVVLHLGQSFSPPLLSGRTSKVHLRSVYTVLEFVVWLVTAGNAQEKGIFQLLFSNRETGAQETDLHWVKQEDGRWTQIWILPETPQPQKYPSVLLHLF